MTLSDFQNFFPVLLHSRIFFRYPTTSKALFFAFFVISCAFQVLLRKNNSSGDIS